MPFASDDYARTVGRSSPRLSFQGGFPRVLSYLSVDIHDPSRIRFQYFPHPPASLLRLRLRVMSDAFGLGIEFGITRLPGLINHTSI